MSNSKGQILPLAMLALLSLSVFIAANGERVQLGIDKINHQKTVDALVMASTNEQARALNAIAALNEGLSIILHRLYIYGVTLTTLGACAASVIGTAWCSEPFATLMSKTPGFLKKTNSLANTIAKWQDDLVTWGAQAPNRTLMVFNLEDIAHSHAFLYPKAPALRIHRLDAKEFVDRSADKEEGALSSGGDVIRCNGPERTIVPPTDDPLAPFLRIGLRKHDQLKVFYREAGGSDYIERDGTPTSASISSGGKRYVLAYGKFRRCNSLNDLLADMDSGLSSLLRIPKPYVLDSDFGEKQRVTVGLVSYLPSNPWVPFIRVNPKPSWALAEAHVEATDLESMEFSPALVKIKMDRELHDSIGGSSIPFVDFALYDRTETHEQISH